MAKKQRKGKNGVGLGMTMRFDASDPQEAAALEIAQLLASKHGRRKQTVVAFFNALYEVYEETGKIMSPVEIANAVHGNRRLQTQFTSDALPILETVQDGPTRTRKFRGLNDDKPSVVVSQAPKASAATIGANMTKSFGAMGFFD